MFSRAVSLTARGLALGALALAGSAVTAQAAGTVTRTYDASGTEGTFVVPAGVESIQVVATGGAGGSTGLAEGGSGERVSGELGVIPGSTLYVEVGSEGGNGRHGAGGGNAGAEEGERGQNGAFATPGEGGNQMFGGEPGENRGGGRGEQERDDHLSPQVGPVAGGTAVTITGGNFVEVSAVRFGAQEASEFKVESSTSITAVAPPALAGSVEVTVTTPSGTSENSSARFGYESGAPEFGRCVSGPVGSGFTDTSCKNSAVAGKFAWLPGLEKTGFTTSSSSTAKFETTSKAKLTCTSATLVGRVISPSAVGDVTIRFKGCQLNANTCTTPGLGAGEIESNPLEGILGFENKARLKAALDLFPDGHSGPFLQYACAGGPTLSITGSVLLPLKADKMAATSKLKLNASKGKQKPEAFEGGTPDVLESSIGGTPDEQTGLKLSLMQVFEEEVEINAVE
jgi:hypothetical protein